MDNKVNEADDDDLMAMLEESQQDFEKQKTQQQTEQSKDTPNIATETNTEKSKGSEGVDKAGNQNDAKVPSPDNPEAFLKDFEKFAKNMSGVNSVGMNISEDEIASASKMFQEMFKINDDTVQGNTESQENKGQKEVETSQPGEQNDASSNPFLSGYKTMSKDAKDAKNLNEHKMPGMEDLGKMFEDPEFKDFFNNFTGGMMGGEGFDPSKMEGMGDPDKMMENLMKEMSGFLSDNQDNPELKSTIEEMMSGVIKKESMYPAMKMMKEELPKYLEEQGESLPVEDLERYNNQLDIIEEVCAKYEAEDEPDQDSIIESLYKLQEYGSPPEALVKKLQEKQAENLPGIGGLGGLGGMEQMFSGLGAMSGFPGFDPSTKK